MEIILSLRRSNDAFSGSKDIVPVTLRLILETPQVLLHGTEDHSLGSVVCGVINIEASAGVKRIPWISVQDFDLQLYQAIHYSKPFIFNDAIISPCSGCNSKINKIQTHILPSIAGEKTLYLDSETDCVIPFSFALPGNIPATTVLGDSLATSIHYEIVANLTFKAPDSSTHHLTTRMPLTIARAVPKHSDKLYVRCFTPTKIKATILLPDVIYPKSTIPLEVVLKGIQYKNRRWKIRKMYWKLNEIATVTEDPCPTHKPLLEELKNRINGAKYPWKLYTDTCSTLEVQKIVTSTSVKQASGNFRADEQIYGARSADEDLINLMTDDNTFHPLDPENPRNQQAQSSQPNTHSEKNRNLQIEEALLFSDERTLAYGEVKTGWKTDYSVSGGKLHLVTNLPLQSLHTPGLATYINTTTNENSREAQSLYEGDAARINCSYDAATTVLDGSLRPYFNVSHLLYLDIEVVEQDMGSSLGAAATGLRRMLRTEFPIILSERPGTFVSWEDECPPSYSSVESLSPPEYSFD